MNAKLGMAQELRNLIAVLINNGRIAHVREVVQAYRTELQERQGIRQAEIVTARELGEQERNFLLAGVGQLAGAKFRPPSSSTRRSSAAPSCASAPQSTTAPSAAASSA